MKRVSFNVAKAIKEAGYPQEDCDEYLNKYGAIDAYLGHNIARPLAMEVWLWLWREKDIPIDVEHIIGDKVGNFVLGQRVLSNGKYQTDPEEAIASAMEYLVTNKLLK